MSAGIVVLAIGACGLTLGIVAWVARPLFGPPVPVVDADPRVVALLARREAVLAALRDLDADRAADRIGAGDHAASRAELVAQGADALAGLDRLAESTTAELRARVDRVEADVRMLAARAAGAASDAAANPGDDEVGASAPTGLADAPDAHARTCAGCGRLGDAHDRFCARCGAPLPPAEDVDR